MIAQTATATLLPQVIDGEGDGDDGSGRFPLEAVIGGAILLAVVGYIALYLGGVIATERYARGFVVDTCPVCRRGQLQVETRQTRLFGIPSPRRIVRCTECRSVLREVGTRRWRYAVDPVENAAVYERFNGREIDEETLVQLANQPLAADAPKPRPPVEPPTFVDTDDQ